MIPVPPAVYRLLVAALLAGGLFGSGWWIGRDGAQDKAREAALLAEAKAEKVRQAAEDGWRRAHWDLAYEAEEKRAEREKSTNQRIACLLDGSCRMRDRFSCPKVPSNSAPSGQPEAEAGGLLPADGVFLVQFARDADASTADLNQCLASYNALRASQ
jgi:hypothetical protein